MKISAAIPALDLSAPAPTSSADGQAAGEGFETAVRAVAEKAGDRASARAESPPPPPERVSDGRKDASASAEAPASKDDEDKPKDETSSADASATATTTTTADLLGRLLAGTGLALNQQGGKGAAPNQPAGKGAVDDDGAKLATLTDADAAALAAAAEEGTTFDGALEERLVITPLGAGGTDGKAQGAAKDRTGVGLEVLHMETHFEPRADDVVLVEGATETVVKTEKPVSGDTLGGVLSSIRTATGKAAQASERANSSEAGSVPVRFDETLARLASGESAADADASTSDDRGSKNRNSDARTTDDARSSVSRSRTETVVDVETTAATPVATSMTSQIADRIVDAFRPSTGQERTADTAPGTTYLRLTAGGAALKTLTIQLQPENLGKLEVSMRLVDGKLTLELAASSAETANALAQDRAGLKKLLEHAGFSMDEASISIVARDSTAATTKSSAGQDAGGQGQQTSSGNGRGGSDASSNGEGGFSRNSGSDAGDSSAGRRGRGESEPEPVARQRTSVFL